jgi:hypothetical protein
MNNIYQFDVYCEKIICILNYYTRKLYKKCYPKNLQDNFQELLLKSEKCSLKCIILNALNKTNQDIKITITSIIIFYYFVNCLEYDFCYNSYIFSVLKLGKLDRKKVRNLILTISISNDEWCSVVRKFCNKIE